MDIANLNARSFPYENMTQLDNDFNVLESSFERIETTLQPRTLNQRIHTHTPSAIAYELIIKTVHFFDKVLPSLS